MNSGARHDSSVYKANSYRGRFAPSPTGALHFGSLVAALASYLDARAHGGKWLVRIEDLDPPREVRGATDDILNTLEAFGFEWDEEVQFQSRRLDIYQEIIQHLLLAGHAFPCACSRHDIAQTGIPGVEGPVYPGTCRSGIKEAKKARSIRIKTDSVPIAAMDRIQGKISQRLRLDLGDYVIRRADGHFAYQLAVVVDDAWQQINQVVRGADLLLSTPRQIHLQRVLGLPTPDYAHLPIVVDETGKKLSKQSRALPVKQEAAVNALWTAFAFLHQVLPDDKPTTLAEFWQWAITHWDIGRIPATRTRSGADIAIIALHTTTSAF